MFEFFDHVKFFLKVCFSPPFSVPISALLSIKIPPSLLRWILLLFFSQPVFPYEFGE